MIEINYKYILVISMGICLALISNSCLASAEKEIPATKFSTMQQTEMHGGKIQFFYCYSCGYKKAFDDYSNILREKYPDILIEGGNFDPKGFNSYFSKLIVFVKLLLILAIISTFDFFRYLGQPIPSWWRWATDNKLYACMMIFFLGNMIEAQLISSGAFEIFLNDVPVWSKIQTGRIPAPQELFQIIDSQLQFSDKIEHNPDFVK